MASNLLHIIQATNPHSDVTIYANKEGLISLHWAIGVALAKINDYQDDFFHSDGEGYGIKIVLDESADCHNEQGEKFPLPYDYLKDNW